jgi:glycine C-acetyltransferase
LHALGYETLLSDHPIVPLFIRDTDKTAALVAHLFAHNILVTGLNYPIGLSGIAERHVSSNRRNKKVSR